MARFFEDGFNVAYLATIWVLVASLWRRQASAEAGERPLAFRFALAFTLLAAGDTFHVGFRVLASAGATSASVAGVPMSLLGLGMMTTAYTVTGFYLVVVDVRRARLGRRDGWFWFMQTMLVVRLVLMALPGNEWEAAVPPWGMGLVRNLPLALAGVPLAALLIREGAADRAWRNIGWAMVVSFACYLPVILFAAKVPALGLLMIPKTIAYVVMGFIARSRFFRAPPAHLEPQPAG